MKKEFTKRILVLLVSAFMFISSFSGCVQGKGDGTVVCLQFIQAIVTGNYEEAYSLIADNQKNLTGEASKSSDQVISLKEFKEKYTSIFDAMELTDFSYDVISSASGTITATVDYSMTYYTSKAGDLTFQFTINSEYSEGWQVIWSPNLIFPTMEWGDTMLSGINYPQRGEIFDKNGKLLAGNVNAVTVYCIPSKIELSDGHKAVTDIKTLFKANDEDLTKEQLEEKTWYIPFELLIASVPELGLTDADVRNSFARTYRDFAKLTTLYPDELTDELEARLLAIPGVGIDTNNYGTVRTYPYGSTLSHILGYAGIIQKEYINEFDEFGEKNEEFLNDPYYDGDSWLGYAGLEKQYESILRGQKGSFAYIQGTDGSNKQILYNIPAVDGEDLHLSIDIDLQLRTEDVIEGVVYDDNISGCVIVLNPKTGAVLSIVSFPGYNPNDFSRGDLDEEAWAAMEKDPQEPLFNRAVQGLYPPGSTFKPLAAIIGLESGTVTPEDEFPYESEGVRNDQTIWNPSKGKIMSYTGVTKVTRTYSTSRVTPMNMKNCMIQSDNIYFAYIAMKEGWEVFKRYLTVMGFNEAIPFELTTQKSQFINSGTEESYDLLAMSGYGQGELLTTPLQLGCYIGGIHNNGKVMTPYLIQSIWQENGTGYELVSEHTPTVWKEICSESTAATIEDMLVYVVETPSNLGNKRPRGDGNRGVGGYGTGRFLTVLQKYLCAGKTGTAELEKEANATEANRELAWFCAYRCAEFESGINAVKYYMGQGGTVPLEEDDERLVLVMLEIDMTKQAKEWSQMKFLIAQALLKDDTLTETPVTSTIIDLGV